METMRHRQNRKYGENLYWVSTNSDTGYITGDMPVHAWYNEEKDYQYTNARFSECTANFTQVIWKESTHMGVGAVKGESGTLYVVANYDPPGNYMEAFPQNVNRKSAMGDTTFSKNELLTIKKLKKSPIHSLESVKSALSERGVTQFQIDCCNAHNDYRCIHGSPPIKLDNEICNFAQEWANVSLCLLLPF